MLLQSSNYEAGLDTSIIKANASTYCLDNYTSTIKFKIDDSNSIIFSNYEILKKYENILTDMSVWTKLNDNYKFRPEYMSNYLYGTTHLWYLILFLNKMTSANEFNKDYVRVVHPDNVGVLNEIYAIEKDHIQNLNVGYPSEMMVKQLDEGSDSIYRKPKYDYLEYLEAADPNIKPSEETIEGFLPLIFNKDVAYLTQPVYYERPFGLTYSKDTIEGKLVSKEGQVASIKPIYMGNSCDVYINDFYLFSCPDNTNEFETFKKRPYSKTMNKVLYNKYEYAESVNWYNAHTNGIFVKINAKFKNLTNLRLKVSYAFAAGTRYETRKLVFDSNDTDIYVVLDISANYGSFNSITFSLLGDFSNYDPDDLIQIDFAPTEFVEENFLFDKDKYYDLKIKYTGNVTTIIPLIAYKFKDYHAIDKKDLVEKKIQNRIDELPSSTSPNNIILNSNDTFKGLSLISLLDRDELASSLGGNYLEDINRNKLYDLNDLLLLYKTPNTGSRNSFKIGDYYISANITSKNNVTKENGAMGFFFKGRRVLETNESGFIEMKSYAYIYFIGLQEQFHDNDQCLLSGLYKLDPSKGNIDLDSEGLNFTCLTKIADTSQTISGNENNTTFVKIITKGNNIKIYDNISKNPIIDYFDPEEIKFDSEEQPTFGLAFYNIRNPIYKNLIVMGRESDRLG